MSDLIASDFNLEKLSTEEFSQHVAATIAMEGNILVVGRRGTGKTAIAKQEIAKAKHKEVYINLSVQERVDMGGYPDLLSGRNERFISYILPKFYQSMIEGNEPVVALLDEVDKADLSLQAPLLEFTQFRTINGHNLPNLKAIILTGNLLSEGGQKPSAPLLDRCEKYILESDSNSWLKWAGENKIHPSVMAFITADNTQLFGKVDPEDRYADPSPRGWHRASDILYQAEKFRWSNDLIGKKISGCVGKSSGINYLSYFEYYQQLLPFIDDIFAGKEVVNTYKDLQPAQRIVTSMMTCSRFAIEVDKCLGKDPNLLNNIGRFLDQISEEDAYIAVRTQIQLKRIFIYGLTDHPIWKNVFDKFKLVD